MLFIGIASATPRGRVAELGSLGYKQQHMKNSEVEFRKWFVDSLDDLRTNGDAGFIFLLVAFPLLERFLRRRSQCPEGQNLNDSFFRNLSALFGEIAGREKDFWSCYRNGLLHHVTFPRAKLAKKGVWRTLPEAAISGHDSRPVYFLAASKQFYVNPTSFFDAVTSAILADFATYESSGTANYNLPSVLDPLGAVPQIVPTINFNLPKTGSSTP